MGIKYFFRWFKNQFKNNILNIKKGENFKNISVDVDNLLIDLNGIFHTSAQKIYEYGNNKPHRSLMNKKKKFSNKRVLQRMVYSDICASIEKIVNVVEPGKRIILCIDGPAPASKLCIVSGTLITMSNGLSKPIESIIENELVLGWNGSSYTSTRNKGLQIHGTRNTIKIKMLDGREIICTPDHKILIYKNYQSVWQESGTLSHENRIVCGIEYPEDIKNNNEKLLLQYGDIILNIDNPDERQFILIFCRILGFVLLDFVSKQKITFGFRYEIDAQMFRDDIFKLTNEYVNLQKQNKYTVSLPPKMVILISDMVKNNQNKYIPDFLLNTQNISIVKEFLGGLFGRYGYTHELLSDNCIYYFSNIKLVKNTDQNLDEYINLISRMINTFGVETQIHSVKNTDTDIKHIVDIQMNTKFAKNIGFRYSLRKNMLLTIANSFWRTCENNVMINLNSFITKTKTRHLFDKKYEWKEIPFYVLPIIDVSPFKPCMVYDIEVDINHSFLANGLCVHNCQQRSRRFKSAAERSKTDNGEESFDQNSITPGTFFMDYLSKYIDWYIRKRISEDEYWQSVEVIFASDKTPGEGEHNCIQYIRHYGDKSESYCIVGVDADLIMLTLATQVPKFYILREDLYPQRDAKGILNEYFCISMENIRTELIEILRWNSDEYDFVPNYAINDFVFFCFMVGNDFLPHIPSVEIMEDGIEIMLDIYRNVGKEYGHLTVDIESKIYFVPVVLKYFLEHIGSYEQSILEKKLKHKGLYFPDPLLESCVSDCQAGNYTLNIDKYRMRYCDKYFFNEEMSEEQKSNILINVCTQYFEGLQWVLSYYTTGVPSWRWFYPFHYCPSASILSQYIGHFSFSSYPRTMPLTPFQQLMAGLPPKSANLMPEPLSELLTSSSSELKEFYPEVFTIDVDGKKNDWEGIVILPFIDLEKIGKCYRERYHLIESREISRDSLGRTNIYRYNPEAMIFRSYYGDIQECKVAVSVIDL